MKIFRQRGSLVFSVVCHALACGAFALWKIEILIPPTPPAVSGGGDASGATGEVIQVTVPAVAQMPVPPRREKPVRRAAAAIVTTAPTDVVLPAATESFPEVPALTALRIPDSEKVPVSLPPAKLLAANGKGRSATGRGRSGSKNGTGNTEGQGRGPGSGAGDCGVSYRKRAELKYPRTALQLGQEGVVRVKVLVDANGRAEEVRVVASSGVAVLDAAALVCARKSLYQPAMQHGKAVAMWVDAAFRFKA